MPSPCVIDVSHHNDPSIQLHDWVQRGTQGIFIKATQGDSFSDPNCLNWAQRAIDSDLLIGLYHFADNSDFRRQYTNFLCMLQKVQKLGASNIVVCLDYERSGSPPDTATAEGFVQKVSDCLHAKTTIYGSDLANSMAPATGSILFTCPIWRAAYGQTEPGAFDWCSHEPWLWQYSDSGVGGVDESQFLIADIEPMKSTWQRIGLGA